MYSVLVEDTRISVMARVAVVTGSNKGIGFSIVKALCKELKGGVVYLTSRDEGRGQAAVEELKKEGLNPCYHQLNITDQMSVSRLRDNLMKDHGGLDILVNNAAIAYKVSSPAPYSEQAHVTMATNYTATVAVCDTLLPILKSHGSVVTVAAVNGCKAYEKLSDELKKRFKTASTRAELDSLVQEFVSATEQGNHQELGWPNNLAYATSKLARISITRIQAADIQKDAGREDILINCCCPGFARTEMSSGKGNRSADEAAATPVFLATLPKGSKEPQGKMLVDKQLHDFW